MSFVAEFNSLPFDALQRQSLSCAVPDVLRTLTKSKLTLSDVAALISPAADGVLEQLCARSQALTRQRFGKVIRPSRAAVSLKRVHQQLSLLRVLARQSDFARDAFG